MSVVKINALTVTPGMEETLERRFAGRAGTVEQSEGFEHFELLRPVEGSDKYLVYTRWRSEEDYQRWAAGPAMAAHGGGGAQGGSERPQPAASGATLWSFDVVQEAGPRS